jgi:hypothetical protein
LARRARARHQQRLIHFASSAPALRRDSETSFNPLHRGFAMLFRHDLASFFDLLDPIAFGPAPLTPRVHEQHDQPQHLRTACHPHEDVVGTGNHKHLCDECGSCWKHANDLPRATTHEQFVEAHSCPECGAFQDMKFGGW